MTFVTPNGEGRHYATGGRGVSLVRMTVARTSGGGIVLSHLSKSYGAVRAVREVHLAIAAG